MSFFDDFTDYGRFKGEPKEFLNQATYDIYVARHGKEWVEGYLQALQTVAIDLSDILQPSHDDVCGFPQTPHKVRTNLREYWYHNKSLILYMTSKIEAPKNGGDKPSPT